MANYPRTEAQMMKRITRNVARNTTRNTKKIKFMHRCSDEFSSRELSDTVERDLCDVSKGETPDSVPNRESDLNSEEERENFKKELEYANRLNRVEDYTGLTISGDEDAKREVLDGALERTIVKSREIDSGSLKGIYIGKKNEKIGEVWDSIGAGELRDMSFDSKKASEETLDTPSYDANTKMIYIPGERDEMITNKVGHEMGHALIDSWGSPWSKSSDLSEHTEKIAEAYEEISADILMKERFGNHQAGEAIQNQINSQVGGVKTIVKESHGRYEEISKFRAKAEIFGLIDIKEKIDNQLFKQHNIDMNSQADERALKINALTDSFTSLQNLDKKKYFNNYEKTIQIGIDAYGDDLG